MNIPQIETKINQEGATVTKLQMQIIKGEMMFWSFIIISFQLYIAKKHFFWFIMMLLAIATLCELKKLNKYDV
jgi:hypothetical protein